MVRRQVGIRELKNGLSRCVARARQGEEIVVTVRGSPVARLVALRTGIDPLAALIAEGLIEPPRRRRSRRPRHPRIRLRGGGPSMASYVGKQRR